MPTSLPAPKVTATASPEYGLVALGITAATLVVLLAVGARLLLP